LDDYTQGNRAIWDAWVAHDLESDHHKDVARFRATGSSLRPIERAELGDVAGKSLLHLMCNMGSETLSWARLGARVTGVDLSPEAIARAGALAAEAGLPARFVCTDAYALPEALGDERFDVVFASYGVLFWLADLDRFARIIADRLNPGGIFCLVEMHPMSNTLRMDELDPQGRTFRAEGPYAYQAEPTMERVRIATAEGAPEDRSLALWSYSIGDVLTALLSAGLRLQSFREHPMAHYRRYPVLEPREDDYWHWPAGACDLPLLFSLRAIKA
jgi:SAM-dependent methyltransferase